MTPNNGILQKSDSTSWIAHESHIYFFRFEQNCHLTNQQIVCVITYYWSKYADGEEVEWWSHLRLKIKWLTQWTNYEYKLFDYVRLVLQKHDEEEH